MNDNISSSDLFFILFGYIVGIGVWALPKSQVASCHQDSWIPTIAGGLYPTVIIIICLYIIKNRPDKNILKLSVEYYGKFIGTFLNFVFLTFFFLIGVFIVSGFNNIIIVYSVPFLSPLKIIGISMILAGVTAFKGLRCISKINKLIFYVTIIVILITLTSFYYGTYLNFRPMFETPISNVFNGAIDTFYSYCGIEAIVLIYPNISDKENIKKKSFFCILTVVCLYTYSVVASVYYSGPDIVVKSLWPFVVVSESTKISVINTFRFIFTSIWILIALRSLTNYYYACSIILEDLLKKVDKYYIYISLYFLFLVCALKFTNEAFRRSLIDLVSLYYVSFNFIFILSIAIFTFLKKGSKDEKK